MDKQEQPVFLVKVLVFGILIGWDLLQAWKELVSLGINPLTGV